MCMEDQKMDGYELRVGDKVAVVNQAPDPLFWWQEMLLRVWPWYRPKRTYSQNGMYVVR